MQPAAADEAEYDLQTYEKHFHDKNLKLDPASYRGSETSGRLILGSL
jgi:hypothetical protein